MTSNNNARLPWNKHFVLTFVDVSVITFLAEWHQKEWKTKWHLGVCTVLSKRLFSWFFRHLRQKFSWNHRKCKYNDQTCLFQCSNMCQVPRKMFENLACGFVFKHFLRDPANVNAWKKQVTPIFNKALYTPVYEIYRGYIVFGFSVAMCM